MLMRQATLIWEPTKPHVSPCSPRRARSFKPSCNPRSPLKSPSLSSPSSSCSEEEYDGIARAPNLYLSLSRKHYETWDAKPGELLSFSGSFFVSSPKMIMRSGAELQFSHFEIEVKTYGRPGRFSRENIWSPAYIDYSSSPPTFADAASMAKTRQRSHVTWGSRTDHLQTGSIRCTFRTGIPMELFETMKTRLFRVTGRAVFLGRKRSAIHSTEVVETNPIIVTMSHLRMAEDMLGFDNIYQ